LEVPGVGFNMLQHAMVGPFGNAFLRDVKKAKRSIFLWTVNEETWMKWSIRKEVDGVVTDDPKKFLEISEQWNGEKIHLPLKQWGFALWMNILVVVFSPLFWWRYGVKVDAGNGRKEFKSSEG
jgi:phosphatidylglycerol phospholipase C